MSKKRFLKRAIALVLAVVMVLIESGITTVSASEGSYNTGYENGSKKGLQISYGMLSDVEDLGISEAFINIPLSNVISNSETQYSYSYNGKTYYFTSLIADYDTIIQDLSAAGINVTAAFVNPYKEGYEYLLYPGISSRVGTSYYAINTVTEDGKGAVEALCHYMASRYNGGEYGKISNYVIGNEVNDNLAYNYVGEMDIDQYVAIYYQTFKTMYDALRAENASANVYIPLEHRWTTDTTNVDYPGKAFLEKFDALSKQDGNIYWNVAYHPYSYPLLNNNVLTDGWPATEASGKATDGGEITKDAGTKLISMKNINVLTDFMQSSAMLNKDGEVRSIILSEQGYTSVEADGTVNEVMQAASIAYAYYAAEMNPYIDAFILNGHVDYFAEYDCYKFGLWNSEYDASRGEYMATTQKAAYNMYKYIDTNLSLQVTEFALNALGIESWSNVIDNFDANKFNNMKSITNGNIYATASMSDTTGAVVIANGLVDDFENVNGSVVPINAHWVLGYNVHNFSMWNHQKDDAGDVTTYHYGTVVTDPYCTDLSYQSIYHEFEDSIDLSSTPYLGFNIKFINHYSKDDSDNMVVRVRVYSGSNVYDANCSVGVNEEYNLFVDLSDWAYKNSVDKVAVWVKENGADKSFDGVFTLYEFTRAEDIFSETTTASAVDTLPHAIAPGAVYSTTVYGDTDYSAVFNAEYYYSHNGDIAAVLGNSPVLLFDHFVNSGMKEGRVASAEFDVMAYKENNGDIASVFQDNYPLYYGHYCKLGKDEGRVAVSTGGSTGGDNSGSGSESGYIVGGVDYSAVFDPDFYYNNNSDVANVLGNDTNTLLSHFVNNGMSEGRQASAEFNVTAYKNNNPDVAAAFGDDTRSYYLHYINNGKAEGRDATTMSGGNSGSGATGVDYSAVFNAEYYYNNNADVAAAIGNNADALLNHFINNGMAEGRQASAEFNLAVYKENNGDVVAAFGEDNKSYYLHYINNGKAEGRVAATSGSSGSSDQIDYSAVFDAEFYCNKYGDVAAAFGNDATALYNHFVNNGMEEGRQGCAAFDPVSYKNNNGDVAAAYGDDMKLYYKHYIEFGMAEGRRVY